jgi:hypothetical protein
VLPGKATRPAAVVLDSQHAHAGGSNEDGRGHDGGQLGACQPALALGGAVTAAPLKDGCAPGKLIVVRGGNRHGRVCR